MTTEQKSFIETVAAVVKKYAPQYGIKVYSPIIAQAIIESNWGKSSLASKYHNYFGMKCGSSWKGKSVNMNTKEEYTVGTLTDIRANFRVFDSLEDGIKGYFDFISTTRYANLKGVTNPQTYLENIKADGYATSSTYVATNMNIINTYSLTQYDNTSGGVSTAKKSVDEIAKEVIAGKWGNGTDRKSKIVAAGYNYDEVQAKVNELSGVKTAPTKSVDEIAREVIAGKWGVNPTRKQKLEAAGYDYNAIQSKVNELSGTTSSTPKKSATEIAKEIVDGKWGNGSERKRRVEQAGYNYATVQAEVNKLLRK